MNRLEAHTSRIPGEHLKENARDEPQEIEQLTLADLQKMPIAFGKANLGLTYEEAFQDQSWTDQVAREPLRAQSERRASEVLQICDLHLNEAFPVKGLSSNSMDGKGSRSESPPDRASVS